MSSNHELPAVPANPVTSEASTADIGDSRRRRRRSSTSLRHEPVNEDAMSSAVDDADAGDIFCPDATDTLDVTSRVTRATTGDSSSTGPEGAASSTATIPSPPLSSSLLVSSRRISHKGNQKADPDEHVISRKRSLSPSEVLRRVLLVRGNDAISVAVLGFILAILLVITYHFAVISGDYNSYATTSGASLSSSVFDPATTAAATRRPSLGRLGLRFGRSSAANMWRRLVRIGAADVNYIDMVHDSEVLDEFGAGADLLLSDHSSSNNNKAVDDSTILDDEEIVTTRTTATAYFRRKLQTASSYFGGTSSSSSSSSTAAEDADSDEDDKEKLGPKLVVAGKMTVDEGPCNVAEMNLDSGQWSLKERIQLSLYYSYSGGEVYYMLPNRTLPLARPGINGNGVSKGDKVGGGRGGGEIILVGAFDTTYRNSQVTYCSVGKWDGEVMSKVGEGLCNSALSRGMKITTAAMAGPNDVFVAGSFHTQVWNGDSHEFVKIFNIAHYDAANQVWMPLRVGQLTCSWCTVTVLSLAWDSKRQQLHVAGKFNAIDGRNIPAGLAIYDFADGHLVAHPGGGLSMKNVTQDGVATSLQLDEESGVLYVMGSFDRLTVTGESCAGLAAYEIDANHWTCLADEAHSVVPSFGGNMLLTPYGLMVVGKVTSQTTWPDGSRPYTIALLRATLKAKKEEGSSTGSADDDEYDNGDGGKEYGEDGREGKSSGPQHNFEWSWLPGFDGWMEPLHTLANGFGDYQGVVFIGGDNLVAKWNYETRTEVVKSTSGGGSDEGGGGGANEKTSRFPLSGRDRELASLTTTTRTYQEPVTVDLSLGHVRGVIMAIAQLNPPDTDNEKRSGGRKRRPYTGYIIVFSTLALGAVLGMCFLMLIFNRRFDKDSNMKGISLDTLTYSAVENTNVAEAYQRAMRTRFVQHPNLLTLIDPQEIILHRIIGEGTFGRVWSARWRTSSVAVKEFVFAQAAVAGRSQQQNQIIEEIIGEAGMMAILRHPNVLQLFGCSLTAQAIWIVSELCSLGSLRQVLDDQDRELSTRERLYLALQVAEGMTYLHTQDPPIIHRDLKSHNILCHEAFIVTESEKAAKGKRRSKKSKSGNKSNSRSTSKSKSGGNMDDPAQALSAAALANVRASGANGGKITSESSIVAKIGDWGSARATLAGSRTMTHGVGTACWLAPEVISHARSSKKSDVYGFGIILWELATRQEVYRHLEQTQIIARVANDNLRPDPPKNHPLNSLMTQCWSENPKDRPSFEDIVAELNKLLAAMPTS